jgi:hypothetical protein
LSHAAFSLFILVVQGMLYSSHGNVQEQNLKEHNPAGGFESRVRLWRNLSNAVLATS